MRISDLSSDVCSSDLRDQLASSGPRDALCYTPTQIGKPPRQTRLRSGDANASTGFAEQQPSGGFIVQSTSLARAAPRRPHISSLGAAPTTDRSEEHTSELQSLMRNSYPVFCLKKKK